MLVRLLRSQGENTHQVSPNRKLSPWAAPSILTGGQKPPPRKARPLASAFSVGAELPQAALGSPQPLPNTLSKESLLITVPQETPRRKHPSRLDFCQSRHRYARDGAELQSSGPRVSRQTDTGRCSRRAPGHEQDGNWTESSPRRRTGEDPSRSQTPLARLSQEKHAVQWRTRQ